MTNIESRIVKHGKLRFNGMIKWDRFKRKCWNGKTKKVEYFIEKAVFRHEGGNKDSNGKCATRLQEFCNAKSRQTQYEKLGGLSRIV
jgi:hypothetical protein